MPVSVLLVDDAAFVRAMLRDILESDGGFRVAAEASDGIAALTLQPELQPDLVVCDLIMPGLDGIETTRALVASDPDARVIVSAAADQTGALHAALDAGARDFVRKPLSPRDVLAVLTPPRIPDATGSVSGLFRLRVELQPDPAFAAARARALLARLGDLGRVVGCDPPPAALENGTVPARVEIRLSTARETGPLRDWVAALPGVASVRLDAVPEEDAAAPHAPPPAPPIAEPAAHPDPSPPESGAEEPAAFARPERAAAGVLRVRASLLDRLLEKVETAQTQRDRLARELESPGEAPDPAAALSGIESTLATLRADVLTARLVPFSRIVPRVERGIVEAARRLSRSARLEVEGGDALLDLGVLDAAGDLLGVIAPRVVGRALLREDILRQLGRPGTGVLRLRVSRTGGSVSLILRCDAPSEEIPRDLLAGEPEEMLRRLGGSGGVVRSGDGWQVELLFPAGIAVIRSYLCRTGDRILAVPVASVEAARDLEASRVRLLRGRPVWEEEPGKTVPLLRYPGVRWADAQGDSRPGFPALLFRVGPQRYALALDALLGESDVVVRPAERGGDGPDAGIRAVLPDGLLASVPDLPRLARSQV
jgi:two-component system chemotaxis response regulator CheY